MLFNILASAIITLTVQPSGCFSPCPVAITVRLDDTKPGDKLRIEADCPESFEAGEPIMHIGQKVYKPNKPFVLRGADVCEVRAMLIRRKDAGWVQHNAISHVRLAGGEL